MAKFTLKKPKADYIRSYKEGDIRGVYPTEIDDQTAYLTGRGFVEEFSYKKVVVGYDVRLSTPALKEAFMFGVIDAGADVIDIGLVSSPMLYFASGKWNMPGAMITASHSPREFNGIKLVAPKAVPLTRKAGLGAIRARIDTLNFKDSKRVGKITQKSIAREYQKYLLRFVKKKPSKKTTIAADLGNGMATVVLPLIDQKVSSTFRFLYDSPDGRFPNRDLDPCLSENQIALKQLIKESKADFGIGFDGDADRIAFLDEHGDFVNCAAIGALVSQMLLEERPGESIVYTNLTSRILKETIEKVGGTAVRSRVGHAFLKRKIREHESLFGAEHSGHFFFKDFYNTDSVILTFLYVLQAYRKAERAGQSFSEMMAPYTIYEQTEDVVVAVTDKEAAMAKVIEKIKSMQPKQVIEFDGCFVDFGEVWGAVKPSVTEFAIKLMFESKEKEAAQEVQDLLLKELNKIADAQNVSF